MNLCLRVFDNRTLVRAQAVLVALLYVFFCTFGMLTHTHASEDQTAAEPGSRSVSAASPQASAHFDSGSKQTLKAVPHCAFCDWEANSLARTVLPVHLSPPGTVACVYLRHVSFAVPVFSKRSSSRAPPIA